MISLHFLNNFRINFSERLLWLTFLQGTPFFNGKLILHDPPGLANGARGVMRPFNPGNILGGNSTNGPGGFMITSPPSKFGAIPKKMPSPAAQVGFSFLPFLHTNFFTYVLRPNSRVVFTCGTLGLFNSHYVRLEI